MIKLKTVVVATDFSKTSDAALAYGRELARTFGAKLQLLHITDNIVTRYAFEGAMALPMDVQIEYEKSSQDRIDAMLREDDRRELGAIAVMRVSNSPADAIVEYAKEAGADVIVVGTHGRKALAHLVLGSVAERVVRLAPCPVLTVRATGREFIAPDAVAMPVGAKA